MCSKNSVDLILLVLVSIFHGCVSNTPQILKEHDIS